MVIRPVSDVVWPRSSGRYLEKALWSTSGVLSSCPMLQIHLDSPSRDAQEDGHDLGSVLHFRLAAPEPATADPALEHRCFLEHEGVRYGKPLRDWSQEPELAVFPEAPGDYRLLVQWRRQGQGGWSELAFRMGERMQEACGPARIQQTEGDGLWAPTRWEAGLFQQWEQGMRDFLRPFLGPGAVAYDIGANLGTYAFLLADLVGPAGQIFAFEANPVCIHFLRANRELAGAAGVRILPMAIGQERGLCPFTLNYGNSNLGVSAPSGVYAAKQGHEIQVELWPLDQVVEELELPPPALIKMDIEGAEAAAVAGMRYTLENHHPVLILELHGLGPARDTLVSLDALGYSYRAPELEQGFIGVEEVLEHYGDQVFQIAALPG